jgi:hypothetical protein
VSKAHNFDVERRGNRGSGMASRRHSGRGGAVVSGEGVHGHGDGNVGSSSVNSGKGNDEPCLL